VAFLGTVGILMLCWAIGHIALPVISRFVKRMPRYRLTRNGKIADCVLAIGGVVAVVVGYA
jgi:hypothetical protein